MIIEVFRRLELRELLNYRLVSRYYKTIIDEHLLRELLIFEDGDIPLEFAEHTPTIRHHFKNPRSDPLNSPNFPQPFTSLLKLSVAFPISYPSNLSKFRRLKELYVIKIFTGYASASELKFRELHTLLIWEIESEENRVLRIRANHLETLSCKRLSQIELSNYSSVGRLTIRDFSDFSDLIDSRSLTRFKRLQVLTVDLEDQTFNNEHARRLVDSIAALRRFQLKEVRFNWNWHILADPTLREVIEVAVGEMMTFRPQRGETDLSVFLFNILATEENCVPLIHQFTEGAEWPFLIMLGQYEQLSAPLNGYCPVILYDPIPQRFLLGGPSEFFQKFRNIRTVINIGELINPDQFILFVNNCRHLNVLEFNITGLLREHFHQLQLNCWGLQTLFLSGLNQEIDYSFICRIVGLQRLAMFPQLRLGNMTALSQHCKRLTHLVAGVGQDHIIVTKLNETNYYFQYPANPSVFFVGTVQGWWDWLTWDTRNLPPIRESRI